MLFALLVGGCTDDGIAAEGSDWPQATYYTVIARPGDSVTALAGRYNVSPLSVARLNDLDIRSRIHPGEILRIPADALATREAVLAEALDRDAGIYAPAPRSFGSASHVRVSGRVTVSELQPSTPLPVPMPVDRADRVTREARAGEEHLHFVWPVVGPVVSSFGRVGIGERNDGINIAAELGEPIHAAATGTVSYAGNELKGYGNLILITHAGGYVTAYAHAQSIAVTRGDHVVSGQVIGTAGETGGVDRPQLHFEIRHGVKPINPRLLLASSR